MLQRVIPLLSVAVGWSLFKQSQTEKTTSEGTLGQDPKLMNIHERAVNSYRRRWLDGVPASMLTCLQIYIPALGLLSSQVWERACQAVKNQNRHYERCWPYGSMPVRTPFASAWVDGRRERR